MKYNQQQPNQAVLEDKQAIIAKLKELLGVEEIGGQQGSELEGPNSTQAPEDVDYATNHDIMKYLENENDLGVKLHLGIRIGGLLFDDRLMLAELINGSPDFPFKVKCPLFTVPKRIEQGDECVKRFLKLFCNLDWQPVDEDFKNCVGIAFNDHYRYIFTHFKSFTKCLPKDVSTAFIDVTPMFVFPPLGKMNPSDLIQLLVNEGIVTDEGRVKALQNTPDVWPRLEYGLTIDGFSVKERVSLANKLRQVLGAKIICPLLMFPKKWELQDDLPEFLKCLVNRPITEFWDVRSVSVKLRNTICCLEEARPSLLHLVPSDLKAALYDKTLDLKVEYCLARDYPDLDGLDSQSLVDLLGEKGLFNHSGELDKICQIDDMEKFKADLVKSQITFNHLKYGIPLHKVEGCDHIITRLHRFRIFKWFNDTMPDKLLFPLYEGPDSRIWPKSDIDLLLGLLAFSNKEPDKTLFLANRFADHYTVLQEMNLLDSYKDYIHCGLRSNSRDEVKRYVRMILRWNTVCCKCSRSWDA